MIRCYNSYFRIDGKPLPLPDVGLNITCTDIDTDDSGRDESMIMHRVVGREGVRTWGPFSYKILDAEDMRYIQDLFAGKAEFEFVYGVARDGSLLTATAYRSKYSASLLDPIAGIYSDLKFNIIEC